MVKDCIRGGMVFSIMGGEGRGGKFSLEGCMHFRVYSLFASIFPVYEHIHAPCPMHDAGLTEWYCKYDHIHALHILPHALLQNDVVFRITFVAQGTDNVIVFTITFCKAGIRHRAQGMNVLLNREYARK